MNQPVPASAQADEWIDRHVTSSVGQALRIDKPWVITERRRFRSESVTFPWPHQLTTAAEARAWLRRVEDVVAEYELRGAWTDMLFPIALGASIAVASAFTLDQAGQGGSLPVTIVRSVMGALVICAAVGGLGYIARRELRERFGTGPTWRRRRDAYIARLDELGGPSATMTTGSTSSI